MSESAEAEATRKQIMKSQAIRQAMVEVIGEHRHEVIRRARAKLVAMGMTVEEAEEVSGEPAIS